MTSSKSNNQPELVKDSSLGPNLSDAPSIDEIGDRLDELMGSESQHSFAPQVPSRIGRFEVGDVMGYGSFGVVYVGHDPQLNRPVAIKLPRPEVLADQAKRERFFAEANFAAALQHPGIVPVYEAQLDSPTPYIVSQLVPGPNLSEWIASTPTLADWQDACQFLAKIAAAIHYAHNSGVFHRDLKPSNVLLVANPDAADDAADSPLSGYEPKITDFGLAKLVDANLADTRSSLLLGTPLYMAPEQLEGLAESNYTAIDIYSLGIMLFELLVGQPPHEGTNYAQLLDRQRNELPTSLLGLRPGIPRDLNRICQRCLARNPAARYKSAKDLANDLEACAAGKPIVIEQLSLGNRFEYWLRQPKRITDAGWFTLASQMVLFGWLVIGLSFGLSWATTPRIDIVALVRDFSLVIVLVHIPMFYVSWQTLRRKVWAVKAGTLLSGSGCVPSFLPLLTGPLLFKQLYVSENSFLVFTNHLIIGLPYLACFLLYLFAWLGLNLENN